MRYLILIFWLAYAAGHIEEAKNLPEILLALYKGIFGAFVTYYISSKIAYAYNKRKSHARI